MKRKTFITFIILPLALVFAVQSFAQVPQLINYQARLTNTTTGLPVADGNYFVTFSIYNVSTGGTALWTEIQNVHTTDGVYSVLLGAFTPINADLFAGTEKYLGTAVGTDPEMTPRKQIVSVPYAISSVSSANGFASVYSETDPRPVLYNNGNIGIGTSGSWAKLDINGKLNVGPGPETWGSQILLNSSSLEKGKTYYFTSTGGSGYGQGRLLFECYNKGTVMVMDSNLNVGIGIDSPVSKLDVNGVINVNSHKITNVADPMDDNDAANKAYVDANAGSLTETDPTWDGSADIASNIVRTGNVGIGITNPPAATLHTYGVGTGGGNVLFVGSYKVSPGDPPASGTGTRMMWYPDKAAFRVGSVFTSNWDKDSIGDYSVAMGYDTKARGGFSTAMGYETTASGLFSNALGIGTTASGQFSTAMGSYNTASGIYSTVLGNNSIASGIYSTAFGIATTASGGSSTAMGYSTTASGQSSTAMGDNTNASGGYSIAIGNYTTAPSGYETAIGRYNTEYTPATTTGWDASDRLFVIGMGTESDSRLNAMTVLKNGNTGLGIDAPTALLHANGTGTGGGNILFAGSYKSSSPGDPPASGAGTRMMWYPDKAAFRVGYVYNNWDKDSIGDFSVAMGSHTKAKGNTSIALGYYTTASGSNSTAMGGYTTASAMLSTSMGNATMASGSNSTAMGYETTASGSNSTAMGYETTASGDYDVAMGYGSIASGSYSTAMGRYTTASGTNSTAMGDVTTALGSSSTAMGFRTTASGNFSTAMGLYAKAIGNCSFAINLSSTTGPDVAANTFRISGASAIGGNLAWTNYSDRRLKKDIQTLNTKNNLEKILQLNGVSFRWKDNDTRLNLGFVAQDVKDIIPESVHYDELNDIYSMEYTAIIPVLVEGIKEQQEVIDKQNSRIETQQSEIKSLQQKIDELYELMKNK